jgi:NCS2 family nucleobase:cation symporter-2
LRDGPRVVYGIEDRPPLGEAIPLGVQHVLAMLLSNITVPLLAAGAIGLATGTTAALIQMALVMAGLATIVQSYPIGPVGGRIPMVMGTSMIFLGAIIGVGSEHGLAMVLGACLAASVVEVGLGLSIGRLRRLFPPLVNSIVVMLIGLTLIPVGMDYAAGGKGAADYGSLTHLAIAATVLVVTLVLNQAARGFLAQGSMLIGVVAGYLVALWAGKVSFAGIGEAAWFALPRPLAFGIELAWGPVVLMAFAYLVTTMETVGDISGVIAVLGREPTTRELRGGLLADGVMSGVAALFGAFPNTSYSQNVGLVNFTGVASRYVTAIGGLFLVAMGLVPKVGALFATIPAPVVGGGGLVMFAMIFASGVSIFHRGVQPSRRNLVILAVSVGLGLGVELRPEVLQHAPEGLRTVFGSGLVTGGLTALLLNLLFRAERRLPPVASSPGSRDALTGLFNRGFFDEVLPLELAASDRQAMPTSLLLVDLDHFKSINDRFGHPEGDRVLKEFAGALTDSLRTADVACRIGGEEFAVILPQAAGPAARQLAERIRERMKERLAGTDSPLAGEGVTATAGIATFPIEGESAEELIRLADERLYEGKRSGRDRVVGGR